jgi:hypothetical protein
MNRIDKLRDRLAESGSQNGPYQPYSSESFKTGWNCASDLWSKECERLISSLNAVRDAIDLDANTLITTDEGYETIAYLIDRHLAQHQEFLEGKME